MPLSKDATYLKDFMMKHMQYLDLMYGYAGYASEHLNFPEFELTPFEYLNFAEKELGKEDASHRINCVNHLKRAVDCEIDTFLQVLNLYTLIQKRNLKFEKKLEIISQIGVFRSYSLEKLNRARNKMEHKYETPTLSDLEMYFDLAYAFVLALEGYMFMLSSKSEMFFESNDIEKFQGGALQVRYDFEKPSVIYGLNDGNNKTEVAFEPSNIEDFLFAVKVYFLLCRRTILVNWDLILDEIKGATS